jgi:maltose-binding protein MalE
LAKRGALKPIDDVVGKAVNDNYGAAWKDLGSYNGKLYGLWFKAANKSTVWDNPKTLKKAGVDTPKTWDDWVSQAGTLVNSGMTPLSIGAADGWVLSDWFENVYLRTAGADKYDQLAKHQIPWTDQSVKDALNTLKQLIGVNEYVAGGRQGALQTSFESSVKAVFGDTPNSAEVYEGDFVANTIRTETKSKAGEDFDFFPFPSIKGSKPAVVGGGDVVVMLKDNPNARRLIEYLATPGAAEIWAKLGGFSSPNKALNLSVYPDDITRRAAQQLVQADVFRFDMSDSAPAAFGATKGAGIWGRLQDWFGNPNDVDGVTSRLEAEAKAAYTG